jgi:hypothetical protein
MLLVIIAQLLCLAIPQAQTLIRKKEDQNAVRSKTVLDKFSRKSFHDIETIT